MVLGAMTIATYVRSYMTTYAQDSLKLAASIAFGATIINGCAAVRLSVERIHLGQDRAQAGDAGGRVHARGTCGAQFHRDESAAQCAGRVRCDGRDEHARLGRHGSGHGCITESLPRAVRSGALAILYAVAIAVFGGSTQFIIQWLIHATASPLAPAWYVTARS